MFALVAAGCDQVNREKAESHPQPPAIRLIRILGEVGLTGRTDAGGVQVYIPGTSYVSITGPRGRYDLRGIEPGDYSVMARADGFETVQLGTVAVPDQPTTSTIRLPRVVLKPVRAATATTATTQAFGRIEGDVLIAGGGDGDLSSCRVELAGTQYRTLAETDGRFLLWSIPAGSYTIRATLAGYPPTSSTVHVVAGRATASTLALRPVPIPSGTRRIAGFVEMRGEDGNLVTTDYSRVLVRIDGRPDKDTTVKADGTFAITGLAPGRYIVTASASGFGTSAPAEIDLTQAPEMTVELRITPSAPGAAATPQPTATIRGKAVKTGADNKDMSGITVSVAGTSIIATTDEEGNFSLSAVPIGSRRLVATATGYKDQRVGPYELAAGDTIEVDQINLDPLVVYPRVVSTDPESGARNLLLEREIPIAIRFNKKMDTDSIHRAISVNPPVDYRVFIGRELPATDFDLAYVMIYGVSKSAPARFRTQYRIDVSRDARDTEGYRMEKPYSMTIRLGGPAIIGTFPANRGTKPSGAPNDPVVIKFNAPIDPSSFNTRSLRFSPRITPDPQFQVDTDQESGWSRLLILSTLDPSTTYRVTLSAGVRTVNNIALDNTPYSFSFRTPDQVPYVPPAIPQRVR
ncbi:carboxypeptidase regulatory-like domain-containing protein [bacterium]|nr:carboxypeptidase regulatory-like domain-containing protein [bacterium]